MVVCVRTYTVRSVSVSKVDQGGANVWLRTKGSKQSVNIIEDIFKENVQKLEGRGVIPLRESKSSLLPLREALEVHVGG